MLKPMLTGSLLICALATSGCVHDGVRPQPAVCPRLQPPSPALMQPSEAGKKVRDELFSPPTSATPR